MGGNQLPTPFEDSDLSGLTATPSGAGQPGKHASGVLFVGSGFVAPWAPTAHTHDDRYFTEAEINALLVALDAAKAPTSHTHDDRYFTESEITAILAGYSVSSHTHAFSAITAKPTTLAGYGIVDAQAALGYTPVNKAGDTITGPLTPTSAGGTSLGSTSLPFADLDLQGSLRNYNTGAGTANYERGYMRWVSNELNIGTEKGGTGTQRFIKTDASGYAIKCGGSDRWYINADGSFTPANTTTNFGSTSLPIYNIYVGVNFVQRGDYRNYNTGFYEGANYERGYQRWNANVYEIGTEQSGTGVARDVTIKRGGTTVITLGASSAATFAGAITASNFANTGTNSLDVGGTSGSSGGANTDCVRIGVGASSYHVQNVVIGRSANGNGQGSVAIGHGATSSGGVSIGYLASSNNSSAIIIGNASSQTANAANAIGIGVSCNNANVTRIGDASQRMILGGGTDDGTSRLQITGAATFSSSVVVNSTAPSTTIPRLKATVDIGATTTRYPVLYVGHNFVSGVTFGTGYQFEIGKSSTGTAADGKLYLRAYSETSGVYTGGADALVVSPNGQVSFPTGLTDLTVNSGSPYLSTNGASDSPSTVFAVTRSGSGVKFNTSLAVKLYTYDTATISPKTRAEVWLNDATSASDATVDTKVLTLQGNVNTSHVPLEVASLLKKGVYTVASLPPAAANAGWEAQVTDSTVAAAGNYGATVAGGGANRVKVFSNGTNWVIA